MAEASKQVFVVAQVRLTPDRSGGQGRRVRLEGESGDRTPRREWMRDEGGAWPLGSVAPVESRSIQFGDRKKEQELSFRWWDLVSEQPWWGGQMDGCLCGDVKARDSWTSSSGATRGWSAGASCCTSEAELRPLG